MNVQVIAFSLLSSLLLLSAAMIFLVRNSVYAALYLISTFILTAGLFILMGAEFLGFVIMIAYIGAVAIFFLFVVMMLNIEDSEHPKGPTQNYFLPLVSFFVVFALELGMVASIWGSRFFPATLQQKKVPEALFKSGFTQTMGKMLYTDYAYFLQVAAIVLLIAMIGSIILTLRPLTREAQSLIRRPRQNIRHQNRARKEDILELIKLEPGQAVVMLSTYHKDKQKRESDD